MFNDVVTFTLPATSSSVKRAKHASLTNGNAGYSGPSMDPIFSSWENILNIQTTSEDTSFADNSTSIMSLDNPFPSFPAVPPQQQFNTGIPNYFADMQQAPAFSGFPPEFPSLTGPGYAPPESFIPFDFDYSNQLFQPVPVYPRSSLLPSFIVSADFGNPSKPGISPASSNTPPCSNSSSECFPDSSYLPMPGDSPDETQKPSPDDKMPDNEGEEVSYCPPVHPPAIDKCALIRPRATRFNPLDSSGRHKCSYDGCPWRFAYLRSLRRHEKSHNIAGRNEYFCCNPKCPTNSPGKLRKGFSRGDSLRRHLKQKFPDDPCVVMARAKGWRGSRCVNEEDMFRVPSQSTS